MDAALPPRPPVELRVEYRRLNAFLADYLRNISRGETFIRTTRPLPVGTAFVFHLAVARWPEPLRLRGTVTWTRGGDAAAGAAAAAAADGDEPGMGIRYDFGGAAARAALHAHVEQQMAAALGAELAAQLLAAAAAAAVPSG